jgi:beta-glucosidase
VVILFAPDAVLLPWIDRVPALVAPFFAGQGMAHALARLLFGRANPSGKLTTSFPARVEDLPAFPYDPGNDRTLWYREDILPGYRTFDRKRIEPLYPFGHGLSYTRFEYSNLTLGREDVDGEEVVTAVFTLTNTGDRDGHEICQLYASWPEATDSDPVRELKGFHKAFLRSGEAKRVEISILASDCRHWRESDRAVGSGWVYRPGPLRIEVGSSSRSLHLAQFLSGLRKPPHRQLLDLFSLPKEMLSGDQECQMMSRFLVDHLGLSQDEADAFIPVLKNSFLGIATTLQWFAGDRVRTKDIITLIGRINDLRLRIAEEAA